MNRTSFLLPVYALLRAVNVYGDGASVPLACGGMDDTVAFNNALNSACTSGGGEVIISPGTCIVSPVPPLVNICGNLTIRGADRKTVFQVKNGSGGYQYIFGSTSPDSV